MEKLYDDLNDYLAGHINYPGWGKGSYPVREQAEEGVASQKLYVAETSGRIAGSLILSHTSEYKGPVRWMVEAGDDEFFYVHTFVVRPDYLRNGVGSLLLRFADEKAAKEGMKSLRLDVYEHNMPAIRLYEKAGYRYIDTVDLGLGCYGLDWFRLYEKLVS